MVPLRIALRSLTSNKVQTILIILANAPPVALGKDWRSSRHPRSAQGGACDRIIGVKEGRIDMDGPLKSMRRREFVSRSRQAAAGLRGRCHA